MFVGLMYVFFCKVSVHILCPFMDGLVCFFPVNLFEFFVNSALGQMGKLQKFFPILLVADSL